MAVLLVLPGSVILAGGIKKARGPSENAAEGKDAPRPWGVIATFALMAAYALLLPLLGFLITTTLYLFGQINILSPRDRRRPIAFAVISVVTSIVTYYTFVKVFQLMLPAGILG